MSELIERIRSIVGHAGLITTPEEFAPYATDWRKRYVGKPLAVVRPASTAEVARVVRACSDARTAIVPQGGNTGLCGAATPDASGSQIVLNLSRMNRVRGIDARNNTMTVEAGCVLANLQKAAEEAGRLLPLSLAAEGSCEIGGNLSTNAGGTAVLRYGNARELVLGLEVVVPSGEIWDGLRGLRKDNTGYDLKQLFIGAEGTLGVITAAVLKLFPLPKSRATAVVALRDPEKALALLERALGACGERVTGFELFSDFCLSLVLKHFKDTAAPFPRRFPYYVLNPGAGFLELARIHLRSAGPRRLEYQARRVDSHRAHRRVHLGDRRGTCARSSGCPDGDVRPSRRRQPALQRVPARGNGPRYFCRGFGADQPHRARQRGAFRRLDQRRARLGSAQARGNPPLQITARTGPDA